MPETAMHHDYSAILWQNDIRSAGQVLIMEPESETQAVK